MGGGHSRGVVLVAMEVRMPICDGGAHANMRVSYICTGRDEGREKAERGGAR